MTAEAQGHILPVGSVVRLADAAALVMVMGFEPKLDDGTTANYLGVPYPMGLVTNNSALAFDASAVAEVVHVGFWDEEAEAGIAAVERFHAATADAYQRVRELVDTMTHERYLELREKYAYARLGDDEPEPELPEDELDFDADFNLFGLDDEPEPEMPDVFALDDDPEPDFPEDEGGLA